METEAQVAQLEKEEYELEQEEEGWHDIKL